jgi:4-aminobutyrate aminotransferase/(S)-3-amino-2-methylpropionate transaminase
MSRNSDLMNRRLAAIPRGVANGSSVFAARAANSEVWDIEGRRYIDFAGGIAVLNTGHNHPRVVAAVEAQLKAFHHTCFQVLPYEPYVALAERLNAIAPFKGPAKTIFFNTGAEAVENAIKIARASTGRSGVIAFSGAFHGRTIMTSALTGKVTPYKKQFGLMPGEIWHVPFPVEHYGVSVEDSLKALDTLFRVDVDPSRIAAIIVEPVQGEGGFHVAPLELLVALRALCDQQGIRLISDEVQTGFARTGKMFAIEHSGVEPDLVTMAKSLSGGFPLSGVLGRADLMDCVEPGGLGSTFGGSPLSCAAALAVLDVIEDEALRERADVLGRMMRARFAAWPQATHVRGLGAMMAFDVTDGAMAKRITTRALDLGLIQLACGVYGETLRFLMPLTITDAVFDEGMNLLEQALEA